MFTIEIEDGREAPGKLSLDKRQTYPIRPLVV